MKHYFVVEERVGPTPDGPWTEPGAIGICAGPAHDWEAPEATGGKPAYRQWRWVACVPLYEVKSVFERLRQRVVEAEEQLSELWRSAAPIDLVLYCPSCGKQHLDIGEFRTRAHRKHLCENTPDGPGTGCGFLWMPFEYATRGVLTVEKPPEES